MNLYETENISIKAFLTENMVSFKEVWPWNKFERFVVLFSNIRFKGEVNFFIKGFLKAFYFPSAFIGYSALKDIFPLRSFSFK